MAAPAVCTCCIVDPGMSAEQASAIADRFKALADPTRVRILNLLLRYEELCVCDLQGDFELSQPTISHHLGLLRKAGLVDCEVRGRWAWYRADRDAIDELKGILG